MAKREDFFECTLACDNNEYRFHFRAWSGEDAEAHFREALQANGVTFPGTLMIRNPQGQVVRHAAYTPTAPADAGGPISSPR